MHLVQSFSLLAFFLPLALAGYSADSYATRGASIYTRASLDELETFLWQRDMDSKLLAFERRQAPPPAPPAAAPAPAPAPATGSTNNANMANNNGAVVASGSNINKEENCKIWVEGRDLHHLLQARATRGRATRRADNGGTKVPGANLAGWKQTEQQMKVDKMKNAKWVQAKTTTDKQGEQMYKNKCYCQCKRDDAWGGEEVTMMQRGIEIVGPDSKQMLARLEPTCSIVGDGVSGTKRWLGKCKRSTLGDYPVTSLLQSADV